MMLLDIIIGHGKTYGKFNDSDSRLYITIKLEKFVIFHESVCIKLLISNVCI